MKFLAGIFGVLHAHWEGMTRERQAGPAGESPTRLERESPAKLAGEHQSRLAGPCQDRLAL